MGDLQGTRILIVEDDAIIAMMVEDMLTDLGCEIAGSAARVDVALVKARTLSIDLAVLDVNLDGEETFPVADILVERGIPFIFTTGYGPHVTANRFERAPTLQKPYESRALEQALARALERSNQGT